MMQTLRAFVALVTGASIFSPIRSAIADRGMVFGSTQSWRYRWAPSVLISVSILSLFASCSLLLDTSRMQCVTDLDCHAVGLIDGVCRENVCQLEPSQESATNGSKETASSTMKESAGEPRNSNVGGTGAVRSGSETVRNPDDDGGASAMPTMPTSSTMSTTSSMTTVGSGTSTAGSQSANTQPASNQGSAGSRAGMMCTGASCPCSADAECEARGISGGTCVEGHCWEPEHQCSTDADCDMRGPEFMGGHCQDKQCLPNPRFRCEPQPPASPSGMIDIALPVIDALQLAPLANVKVLACNKLDLTCGSPIGMAMTGTDGKAKFSVPANFAGYMQQTERTDYVPAMYFMPAQLPMDGLLRNLPLVPAGSFTTLAVALGAQPDNKRGHAMLIVEDCKGTALAGISFTSPQADKGTVPFYVRDQIPTSTAKDTPPEGDGGFANLPPGTVEIVATEAKTGLVINTVTVLVREGFITTAYIRPASRGSTVTGRFPVGP